MTKSCLRAGILLLIISAVAAMCDYPVLTYFARKAGGSIHRLAAITIVFTVILSAFIIALTAIYLSCRKRAYRNLLDIRHKEAMLDVTKPVSPPSYTIKPNATDDEIINLAEQTIEKTEKQFPTDDLIS